MESDCKYFLGYGNGCEKHLWGGNIDEHISSMMELYKSFPDDLKPEWINETRISEYADAMKKKTSQKVA
jgi:hypothetical protein